MPARCVLLGFITPALVLAQLHVSVTDKAGNPVPELPQSAFHVLADGVEQPIRSFETHEVPISIGLVIDNGARMRDKRPALQRAVLAVLDSSNAADEMFVLGFNTTPYLDQPFTNDPRKLRQALDKTESRGWSLMRDAVDEAVDYAQKHAKNQAKVLFVIDGGEDDTSRVKMKDLIQKAQSGGVAIYGIGLLDGRDRDEKKTAQHELKALSEATGGIASYPKDASQTDDVILKFARQIRNEYLIGFAPAPGHVTVRVDLPDLTVRVVSLN
jgi:Ca-activated chloride channel homolog